MNDDVLRLADVDAGALIALLWETSITSLNSALPTDTVEASPGQIVDGASGIG